MSLDPPKAEFPNLRASGQPTPHQGKAGGREEMAAHPQLRARAVVCGRFHTMAVMDAAQACDAVKSAASGTTFELGHNVSRFFMSVPLT